MQTNKTGVNTHVQPRKINLFNSWKCEKKFSHNRLRKSQAKRCVTMGTPNITTTPHLIIKQVTLHIPKVWANHNTEKHLRNY